MHVFMSKTWMDIFFFPVNLCSFYYPDSFVELQQEINFSARVEIAIFSSPVSDTFLPCSITEKIWQLV